MEFGVRIEIILPDMSGLADKRTRIWSNRPVKKPKVLFIKSGVTEDQYPPSNLPEIAFVGRSNAGKSSLINAIAVGPVAKVGQTPGKTRLINFFAWEDTHILVDLPGYGFARGPEEEKDSWKEMIETYLTNRDSLSGLILVMDVRRKWSADEDLLLEWCRPRGLQIILALNKLDQLNQSEKAAKKKEFGVLADQLELFWVSAKDKKGVDELRRRIFEKMVSRIDQTPL